MKNNIVVLIFTLFILSSCANPPETKAPIPSTATKMDQATQQLRHVVLFKFNDAATPSDINKVEAAFAALPSKIKEIKDFEWGINNSTEALNKGFTHCFFVTFDTEEERSIYLPHPDHLAFVDVLGPHLDDVLVLDYWSK
jgi:hypothetical protein